MLQKWQLLIFCEEVSCIIRTRYVHHINVLGQCFLSWLFVCLFVYDVCACVRVCIIRS